MTAEWTRGAMFKTSYKIARVWGIPIRIHFSLLLLLLLLALEAAGDGLAAILLLLVLEAGIVLSIALHELGHSFVALRKGCRVRDITLMFMGGAARMERIPRRPFDEFEMAIAGPLVSLALALLAWFGGAYLPLQAHLLPIPFVRGYLIRGNMVQYLGLINAGLALFNLLPSFPMDGGRVFRALLTPRLGRLRATYVASRVGRLMAVGFGFFGFLRGQWVLVAIAFFIFSAADSEYRMVEAEEMGRQRWGDPFWPRYGAGAPEDEPASADRVIVAPPPYRRGRGRQVDIERDDDGWTP